MSLAEGIRGKYKNKNIRLQSSEFHNYSVLKLNISCAFSKDNRFHKFLLVKFNYNSLQMGEHSLQILPSHVNKFDRVRINQIFRHISQGQRDFVF